MPRGVTSERFRREVMYRLKLRSLLSVLQPGKPTSRLGALGVCVAILLVLSGCGGTPPSQQNTGILGPNTKLVGQAELAHLTAVSEEGVYSFSGSTAVIAGLEVGDVLLIDVSALTPIGGVRRIDLVAPVGAGVDVHTSQAALEDAFQELRVSGDYASDADMDAFLTAGGTLQQLQPAQAGITFPIDIQVSGGGAQARLQGSLGIAPRVSLNIDIDIVSFSLEELALEFEASETFDAAITGTGDLEFQENLELGRIPFFTILIPIFVPGLGIVTIPVTPTVIVETGVQGSFDGEFEASVVQTASFTSKVGYANGSWGATSDSDSSFDFDIPVATASLNVKAYGAARVLADIAGIGGPYARAEVYLGLNASAESPPPCVRAVLDAGLLGSAGAVFVGNDFSTVLFDERTPLASLDSCDPSSPRPATVWSRSYRRTGSVGENARAVAQASDGTYIVAGDSGLIGGVTGSGASVWALRLDEYGNVLWQRAYDVAGGGNVIGVLAQGDGFFLVTTRGVLRLDSGGNVIWARRLDGSQTVHSVAERHGGGVVVAGRHGDTSQAWIASFDAAGTLVWSRTYGPQAFNKVRQTAGGGYVGIGVSPSGALDVLVVKIAGNGSVEWSTTINNTADPSDGEVPNPTLLDTTDIGYDIIQRPGGSYLVVGETYGAFPVPEPYQGGFYAVFVADLSPTGELTDDPTVHRASEDAHYSMGQSVALRSNGTSVIVGRYADTVGDLLVREKVLLIQGSAYSLLGGSGNTTVLGSATGSGAGSMPIAATADGGVIVVATGGGLGANDELWVTKYGRTLFIDFGLIGNTSGESFKNDRAVQVMTGTTAVNAALNVSGFTPYVEVTPHVVRTLMP